MISQRTFFTILSVIYCGALAIFPALPPLLRVGAVERELKSIIALKLPFCRRNDATWLYEGAVRDATTGSMISTVIGIEEVELVDASWRKST